MATALPASPVTVPQTWRRAPTPEATTTPAQPAAMLEPRAAAPVPLLVEVDTVAVAHLLVAADLTAGAEAAVIAKR